MGIPGPHTPRENGVPGPYIPGSMGTRVPIFPGVWGPGIPILEGPHFHMTPDLRRTAASVAIDNTVRTVLSMVSLLQIVQIITVHVTARPNQRQTVSAWANHVGSMLLECLDSDADASVVVVLLQWLNQKNTRRSLGTRPRQDYAHRVILVLAGVRCISTWLSHRLETVTLCLQGTFVNQAPIGGFFSHFRFRTSVSVSAFSTCPSTLSVFK